MGRPMLKVSTRMIIQKEQVQKEKKKEVAPPTVEKPFKNLIATSVFWRYKSLQLLLKPLLLFPCLSLLLFHPSVHKSPQNFSESDQNFTQFSLILHFSLQTLFNSFLAYSISNHSFFLILLNFCRVLKRKWNRRTLTGAAQNPCSSKMKCTRTSKRLSGSTSVPQMSSWMMIKPGSALLVGPNFSKICLVSKCDKKILTLNVVCFMNQCSLCELQIASIRRLMKILLNRHVI